MTTTTAIQPRAVRQRRDISRLLPAGAAWRASSSSRSRCATSAASPTTGTSTSPTRSTSSSDWIRDNERTHPVFQYFFQPISDAVDWSLDTLATQLQQLPWFALPLIVVTLIGRTGHWFTAVLAAVAIALPGMFGLWEPTMETLALMLVVVAISVVIGVPLGVAAGLNRRFYAFLRPVLDAMQTVPSTAYLVPAVLFFGIGPVPAAVATVIYALAPVVRLTALGDPPGTRGDRRGRPRVRLDAAADAVQGAAAAGEAVDHDRRQPDDQHGARHHRHRRPRRRRRSRSGGARDAAVAFARPRPRRRPRHRRCGDHARPRQPLVHPPPPAVRLEHRRRRTLARRRRDRARRGRRRPPGRMDGVPRRLGRHVGRLGQRRRRLGARQLARAQTKWLNEFLVRDVHVRITSWLEQSVAWPVLVVGCGPRRLRDPRLASRPVLRTRRHRRSASSDCGTRRWRRSCRCASPSCWR